jgi:hypothetical protein
MTVVVIKNQNFNKLLATGCSYTFGTELPEFIMRETPYFKNNRRAVDLFNERKSWHEFKHFSREELLFWNDVLYNDYYNPLPPENFSERKQVYIKLCHQLAYPGLVAKKLNISNYINVSQPGLSNMAILINLIRNKKFIDSNTLVIVGITHPLRKIKFVATSNPASYLENIFLHFHIRVEGYIKKKLNHEHLKIYPIDDDSIIQEMHCVYEIIDICNKLNCSYIIYDAVGNLGSGVTAFSYLTDQAFVNYKDKILMQDTLPSLHKLMNDKKIRGEYRCFAGHPNHLIHNEVAELMYKQIIEGIKNA